MISPMQNQSPKPHSFKKSNNVLLELSDLHNQIQENSSEKVYNEKISDFNAEVEAYIGCNSPNKKKRKLNDQENNLNNPSFYFELLSKLIEIKNSALSCTWFNQDCHQSLENLKYTIQNTYISHHSLTKSQDFDNYQHQHLSPTIPKKEQKPRLNNLLMSFLRVLLQFIENILSPDNKTKDSSLIKQGNEAFKNSFSNEKIYKLLLCTLSIQKEYKISPQGKNQNQFMKLHVKQKIPVFMFSYKMTEKELVNNLYCIIKEDVGNQQVNHLSEFMKLYEELIESYANNNNRLDVGLGKDDHMNFFDKEGIGNEEYLNYSTKCPSSKEFSDILLNDSLSEYSHSIELNNSKADSCNSNKKEPDIPNKVPISNFFKRKDVFEELEKRFRKFHPEKKNCWDIVYTYLKENEYFQKVKVMA